MWGEKIIPHEVISMYIHYKSKNGVEYATLRVSKRVDKKVVKDGINLGRVLDKERGIYKSRTKLDSLLF